jgi:hypothetical protein
MSSRDILYFCSVNSLTFLMTIFSSNAQNTAMYSALEEYAVPKECFIWLGTTKRKTLQLPIFKIHDILRPPKSE